jgi:hypothetical protein
MKKITCKICGGEAKSIGRHVFRAHNISAQEYYDKYIAGDTEGKCLVCGKETKFLSINKGYNKYCSTKCSANSRLVKDNYKKTMKSRYGVDHPMKSKDLREKFLKTNNKRYGGNSPFNSSKIVEKWKQNNIKKYGVDVPFKLNIIKNKYKQTCLEKYGEKFPWKYNGKMFKRNLKEKYNNENYNNHKKYKQTCLIKYNVNHYSKTEDFKIKSSLTQGKEFYKLLFSSDRLKNKVEPLFDIEDYKNCRTLYEFKCKKCGNIFEDTLKDGRIPRCTNCYPIKTGSSEMEIELKKYIKKIIPNENIIYNDRSILNGKELDIYIPNKKIAIEFDGLYWHSEISGNKDKNYHLNKTKICLKNNIQLIHIFEDEWINKKDIIKFRLKNLLIENRDAIYARKCDIKEITKEQKNNFLNKYHLQGSISSNINFGLFQENKLLSVICLGSLRKALGSNNKKNEYEILRFASNKKVIGGFAKLIKHFIRLYNPKKIITYADRKWSDGNIYKINKFEKKSETNPNYWYLDKKRNRFHRFGFRKDILNEKLENFDPNLTEWQNMQLNGYDRIWDCGNVKYELNL